MKVLIIGGNRFVGLRLSLLLDKRADVELHVLNRTGQVAHAKNATVYKGDRNRLEAAHVQREFDVIVDFAAYTAKDAQTALNYFTAKRWIFISTASVYDPGLDRAEDRFAPENWPSDVPQASNEPNPYQFGKRQAEAVYHRAGALMIRFPFILGPDDYTHRLALHVGKIERGEPLFVPNLDARISMIHSEDAAAFLAWALDKKFTGPLNVASPQPISLKDLLTSIERRTGLKTHFAKSATPDNHSPYGESADSTMNVSKCEKLGFKAKPIVAWLPGLIDELATSASSLH